MRSTPTLLAIVAGLALAGCGGSSKKAPAPPAPPADDAGGQAAESGDEDEELEVVSTRGKIDPEVVSRAIEPHARTLEACYVDQVGRRKWLGGGLELTWEVAGDGTVTAVKLSSSDLGAWAIEKCVLEVARQLSSGAPRGNKPARVSAPLTFSAGSGAVAWDQGLAEQAVGGKTKDLAGCPRKGAPQPTNVAITMYVGTRGKVQSVGFASPSGFDDAWADCAEGKAMAWALTDPRGKVAKLSFVYNPAELPSEDGSDDGGEDF